MSTTQRSTYDPTVNLRHIQPGQDIRDFIYPENRNYIIAVPKYHENLYRHLKNKKEWLIDTESVSKHGGKHYRKKIKTPEDLATLNQLLSDLRTEKSELFIDDSFHRKPTSMNIRDYINEFLRLKGIFSYYTFTSWYRVTVFGESGHPDCEGFEKYIDNKNEGIEKERPRRKEYLIVPLLIRLKKNKTFDQFKSIHYTNASGTEYEIRSVNSHHFLKDLDPRSRDQDEKLKYQNASVEYKQNKPKFFTEDEVEED